MRGGFIRAFTFVGHKDWLNARIQAKPIYPSVLRHHAAEYDEETCIKGASKSHKLTATRAIIARPTYRILATVMREYQVSRRVRNPAVKRCSRLRGFVTEENAQKLSGISMSSGYIVEKGQLEEIFTIAHSKLNKS